MQVTRTSPFTNKPSTMELDVSIAQMDEWCNPKRQRLIQEIFPNLSQSEREFIKTGYTQEDWNNIFAGQDD